MQYLKNALHQIEDSTALPGGEFALWFLVLVVVPNVFLIVR